MNCQRLTTMARGWFAHGWGPVGLPLALVAVSACVAVVAQPAHAEPVFLTREESDQVVAIALADSRVHEALGGAVVHVESVLPWSEDGTRKTLIGGEVTLALDRPSTLEADWPLMDWSSQAGYTFTTVHYRAEGVDALTVDVDLRQEKVMAFDIRDGVVDESTVRQISSPTSPADGKRTTVPDGRTWEVLFLALVGVCATLVVIAIVATRRRRSHAVGEMPSGS